MKVRISREMRQQQKGLRKSRILTGSFLKITECKTFHDLILCFDEESIMVQVRILWVILIKFMTQARLRPCYRTFSSLLMTLYPGNVLLINIHYPENKTFKLNSNCIVDLFLDMPIYFLHVTTKIPPLFLDFIYIKKIKHEIKKKTDNTMVSFIQGIHSVTITGFSVTGKRFYHKERLLTRY